MRRRLLSDRNQPASEIVVISKNCKHQHCNLQGLGKASKMEAFYRTLQLPCMVLH